MSILQVENLQHDVRRHFWTPRRPILRDVSFAVEAGEIFGFVGPNGAGKTTTIKSILGLLRPTAGRIEVCGGRPSDPRVRAHVGFMPEQAYFSEYLTARELLLQHALLAGARWREASGKASAALEQVGLGPHADGRLGSFSKGMLQRAGLAQALVGAPQLVVLDEPMSGLDPLGRHDVRELMLDLRRRGTTVFFSTHILPDVELLCDRVGIIVAGTTRKVGRLDELLGGAVRGVEVVAEVCPPALVATLEGLATVLPRHGGEIVLTCTDLGRANEVIDVLRRSGVGVRGVQVLRRSLEALFVAETEQDTRGTRS
ncbi:MAG: ABC transporter ATP-binding protein [Deltaproteobacteria bacterium]|nr:ABC transporter ATP-binding protein [Deltaproteobacteria bacterium]